MLPPAIYRIHSVACWILIGLGLGHGLATMVDVFAPTFFTPRDPEVLDQMRAAPVSIGAWLGVPEMTVWRGHLGWNFSVALAFIFLGAVQLLLRRSNRLLPAATPIVPLATVTSLGWTVIAATCWFWLPALGFAVATLGLAVTWKSLRRAERPARVPGGNMRLLWLGALGMGIAGALHGLGTIPDIFTEGFF